MNWKSEPLWEVIGATCEPVAPMSDSGVAPEDGAVAPQAAAGAGSMREYFRARDAQTKRLAREDGQHRKDSRFNFLAGRSGLRRMAKSLIEEL